MKIRKSFRLISLLIIVLICFSCGKRDNILADAPDNVIPREKMINVLVDLHLIEASMAQYYGVPLDMKMKAATYYAVLYKKYSITHSQLVNSLYYYSIDLKYFGKLYQEVITRLSVMQSSVR